MVLSKKHTLFKNEYLVINYFLWEETKNMFKKFRKNEKGFTLAELLIVVAIIGVLVAISIPIFTSQLEKSRDAVTASNVRAAYAEAQTAWLTGSGSTNVTVDKNAKTVSVDKVAIKGEQDGGVTTTEFDFPFIMGTDAEKALGKGGKTVTKKLTFTYNDTDAQPTLTVG